MPSLTKEHIKSRNERWAHIAIRRETHRLLKQLAGDTSINSYLWALLLAELHSRQGGLPGLERAVSPATMASVSARVDSLALEVVKLAGLISGFTGIKVEQRAQGELKLKVA